jgi:hypothetical protein
VFGLRRALVVGGEVALNGLFSSLRTVSKLRHSQQASKFRKFRNPMLDYSMLLNFVKPLRRGTPTELKAHAVIEEEILIRVESISNVPA